MPFAELSHLKPQSTLADLPAHSYQLDGEVLGKSAAEELENRPELPGVIVNTDDGRAILISRRTFFQQMSRGFSREIYLRRPIQVLAKSISHFTLQLPASFLIGEAAALALERPTEQVYEPILVQDRSGNLSILDAYVLLLGQAQLLALTNTALKEAQASLIQNEKMASLGQLAAGVAHEINNPVAFVITNLSVLHREMEGVLDLVNKYGESRELLRRHQPVAASEIEALEEDIDLPYIRENVVRQFQASQDGMRRVRDIVRNLCDFAHLHKAEFAAVDLNDAVRSTVEIVQHELKRRNVQLTMELERVPRISGHLGKLNQVILNLLMNAIHACQPGGLVCVRTIKPDESCLFIEVQDNGCGIRADHLLHIFEPFFTTKPIGQGTGLGLFVSYEIVRDHGGSIKVESTPGRGTIFRVRLPRQSAKTSEENEPTISHSLTAYSPSESSTMI